MVDIEAEVPLGPDWLQKILVVSHERSGTHFLMNTIAQNFHYISADWIDLDCNLPVDFWNPDSIMSFIDSVKGAPVAMIFKSHHAVEFFLPVLDALLEEFFIFYIRRNPTNVMESFCKHLYDKPGFAGPICKNGEELAQTAPAGAMMRYQWTQHKTCYERWHSHVTGWTTLIPEEYHNRVIHVSYEDLNEKFDQIVKEIGNRIGMVPPHHPKRPVKGINTI